MKATHGLSQIKVVMLVVVVVVVVVVLVLVVLFLFFVFVVANLETFWGHFLGSVAKKAMIFSK